MNKQRLFEIISQPANLHYDTDLPLVKELIESFPYFPVPYVMLSKMLHDENSIYFDKNLKLAAAYTGNRELLYNYIKGRQPEKEAEPVPELKAPEPVIEDKHVEVPAPVQPLPIPVKKEPYFEMVFKAPVSDLKTVTGYTEPAEQVVTDQTVEPPEPELAADIETTFDIIKSDTGTPPEPAVPGETLAADHKKSLPKEMFSYIAYDYFGQFYKDEKKEVLTEKAETADAPALPPNPEIIEAAEVEQKPVIVQKEELKPVEIPETTEAKEPESQEKNEPVPEIPAAANEKNEKDLEILQENKADPVTIPHRFTDWFDLLETIKKPVKEETSIVEPLPAKEDKLEINTLIERFIKAEPRIKPQQTRMYNPEDMARKSAKEDFTMATETLAGIYLKQGLTNKAIEIFQQLILKFPQKSTYFAAKIREIQSEGNL